MPYLLFQAPSPCQDIAIYNILHFLTDSDFLGRNSRDNEKADERCDVPRPQLSGVSYYFNTIDLVIDRTRVSQTGRGQIPKMRSAKLLIGEFFSRITHI